MVLADAVGTDLLRAVLQGAPPGTVYALIALGFVLTYKTSGVFNLAFGAQAYVSAVVYHKAHTEWGWGIVPSVVVAVAVLAPLVGFALEWLVFRHLRTASALAKLVVTIGLSIAIPNIVALLLHFQGGGLTPEGVVPNGSSVFYEVFGVYSFSRNELAAMVIAVVAVAALVALFRFTAIGLRMRAVVESPRLTELNGIGADRVSAFAWALSSLFAGLAGVLIAPRFNALVPGEFFNLVVVAVAAAAIGRLVSLPRAVVGGLALGMLISLFNTFVPQWAETWTWLRPLQDNLTPAIPFVVLFAVLVLDPRLRRAREAGDPLSGVDPPPVSTASVARAGRSITVSRAVTAAVLVGLAAVVVTRADTVWTFRVTQALVMAIILLSITVITGLAGQISLCQGTFAAIGAFTAYQLSGRHGMSVLLAALIGAAIAALVGGLLSLPLRRLSGVWVAIATLAFAFFFDAVMVKFEWIGGAAAASTDVPRPVIGPWDFGDDRAFLVLVMVVLAVAATAVVQLRAGTIGQQLRALRGSEIAAQSIGISPVRARATAFALAAFIAGLGGALLAMQQENVNYATNFTPFATLLWLVVVVTMGSTAVSGAVAGAASFALADAVLLKGALLGWILRSPDRIPGLFPLAPEWLFIGFGLATIQFARHPEGAIEMARRRRAMRRAKRVPPTPSSGAVLVAPSHRDVEEAIP